MNKKDIKIDDEIYWNTKGAFETDISLKAVVMDKGEKYIWILVYGNLGPTPISDISQLSKEPLFKVTNSKCIKMV